MKLTFSIYLRPALQTLRLHLQESIDFKARILKAKSTQAASLLKTDSLSYSLFETAPSILFELIGQPELAPGYTVESVELKQTAFLVDDVANVLMH